MLVSVIVPVYNAEVTILRALNSLLDQTYKNIEILVVDNNSTDDGLNLIKAIDDPRIHVFECNEQGVSFARNMGLDNARGDYICFLDADDFYLEEAIENRLEFICRTGCPFIVTNYYRSRSGRLILEDSTSIIMRSDMRYKNHIPMLTVTVKKELIGAERFKNIKHEDFAFWLTILSKESARCLPSVTAVYDDDVNGISSNKVNSLFWHYSILRNEYPLGAIKSIYFTVVRSFSLLLKRKLNEYKM